MYDDKPWWWFRCTHREYPTSDAPAEPYVPHWQVIKEAEGVVVLYLAHKQKVHILVNKESIGSVCKVIAASEYHLLETPDVTRIVQQMLHNLKQDLQ